MLIEFTVENLFCFGAEVRFSLVASSDDKHQNHLIEKTTGKPLRLLRVSGVYGANGHGKTKLVEALQVLKRIVTNGVKVNESINIRPFRLNTDLESAPTRFSINFHADNSDYEYGLVATKSEIVEEWLFMRRKTKEIMLFEREASSSGEVKIEFGASLKKSAGEPFLKFVAKGTRKNQPFLKEAIERNVRMLEPAYRWFSRTLTIISAESIFGPLHSKVQKDSKFLEFLGDFLRKAGTGIEGIELEEKKIDDNISEKIPDELMQSLKDDVSNESMLILEDREGPSFAICKGSNGGLATIRIRTVHKTKSGKKVLFSIDEESAGARRLTQLIPMLADLVSTDRVYIVDELDRKLHPLLAYEFIEYFLSLSQGRCNSQLVFTTHNTHLLDLDLLRRDEVWFVEKDRGGESKLYSLVNLKIRPDLDIEKGYLRGRFGAVPFLGNLSDLGWKQ